jgi:hypothetical protein
LVAGTGAPVSDSSSFSISLAFTASAAICRKTTNN